MRSQPIWVSNVTRSISGSTAETCLLIKLVAYGNSGRKRWIGGFIAVEPVETITNRINLATTKNKITFIWPWDNESEQCRAALSNTP